MEQDPNLNQPNLFSSKEFVTSETPSVYKVTRRFDLVNVFVVTFFCSVVLGILQAYQVSLQAQAAIISAITLVALVQMFAPESLARIAAVGCGWVVVGCMEVYQAALHDVFINMVSSACLAFGFGSLFGYCAGTAVAGIFLISDYVQAVLQNIFVRRDQVED